MRYFADKDARRNITVSLVTDLMITKDSSCVASRLLPRLSLSIASRSVLDVDAHNCFKAGLTNQTFFFSRSHFEIGLSGANIEGKRENFKL